MTDTQIIKGKVKTVFTTSEPDQVLIQYEDKVTAGNGRKVDFPEGKGRVCCEISELLFEKLEKRFQILYGLVNWSWTFGFI